MACENVQSTRTRPAVCRSAPHYDGLTSIPINRCLVGWRVSAESGNCFAIYIDFRNAVSAYCATHPDAGGEAPPPRPCCNGLKSGGLQLVSLGGISR